MAHYHKQKKNKRNHEKRRILRQKTAQNSDTELILTDEQNIELEKQRQKHKEERDLAEEMWLEREEEAQKLYRAKRAEEEKRKADKEELKRRIREEFQELQEESQVLAPNILNIKSIDPESREEMLKQFETLIEDAKEEEYSNPLAPSSYPQYGTELDVKYCSFYLKTGACRFGDRCSRYHMKPPSSDTILLPSMFQHISLGEDFTNDLDTDSGLEHEDVDTNKVFTEFFWDVFPEFQAAGQVTMFKVCCNHEPHLRGNVYVQYQNEHEAVKAYAKFNGRFYAGRQISCEFVKIEKWKSAICGQFHRMKCPKGKHCNFLHVFKNPGGLFMVHGSEVSAGPNRSSLSMKGEHAVRNLDCHPVVQAARARAHGFPGGGRNWPPNQSGQNQSPGFRPCSPFSHHQGHTSPGRGSLSPHRGRGGLNPYHGRGGHSPSPNRNRGGHSPSPFRGRGGQSPSPNRNRGGHSPSPFRGRGGHSPSPNRGRGGHSPSPNRGRGGHSPSPNRGRGGHSPSPHRGKNYVPNGNSNGSERGGGSHPGLKRSSSKERRQSGKSKSPKDRSRSPRDSKRSRRGRSRSRSPRRRRS